MMGNYWTNVMQARLGRRRALTAVGVASAAAAMIAACGGGASSGSKQPVSKMVAAISDETPNVKRGGSLKIRSTLEHPTLDPMAGGGHVNLLAMTYSNLFRVSDGYKERTKGEIVGDLAESWEFSPDQLQLTIKLNAGAVFAPLAPVNGRAVDAEDVLYSWRKFAADGRGKLELSNAADPNAPVVSVTSPDPRTVVFKLKEPNSVLLSLLGLNIAGSYFIMPRESQGGFDIRRQMIGSGPFYLKRYEPSVTYEFARNPGFKQDKRNLPYVDEVSMPIVLETATAVSQFRAGQIWGGPNLVPAGEIVALKNALPDLNLFDSGLTHAGMRLFFGHLPASPFKDERLRQAWMYAQDRDLFLDASYDVEAFKKQGIDVGTTHDHALWGDAWGGWYADPRSKDFGANSKYVQHDVAEAKKLVAAAGSPNGAEVTFVHTEGYMGVWQKQFDMINGFAANSGAFKVKIVESSYAQGQFQTKYRDARGQFEGVSARTDSAPDDPTLNLFGHYNSKGAQYQGNDATLEDLTNKMLKEFDTKKRQALAHEVQRYDAKSSYFPLFGSANVFELWWPVVRNVQVWQGGTNRTNATFFIDDTKPPLSKKG
jgi:peptide/nickel transport system substrate-binding protein